MLFRIFILLFLTWSSLWASERKRVIKIGSASSPPLVFLDERGRVDGIIPQLFAEIAKENNWEVEWSIEAWAMQLERLKSGDLDLMGSIGYSTERAEFFDFNEESILTVWGQVYMERDAKLNNFLSLDGKKVAVLNNGISGLRFAELCQQFSVNCQIVAEESYQKVFEAIDNGKVDAGVVNSHYGMVFEKYYRIERSEIMFNPFAVLFATKRGDNLDVLAAIDRSLRAWKLNKNSVYFSITKGWLEQKSELEMPVWMRYTLWGLSLTLILLFGVTYFLRSEVKRRTKELSLSEAQLRQVINIVPHAIFATDAQGQFIMSNLESTRVFNRSAQQLKLVTRSELMKQQPHLAELLSDDALLMGNKSGTFNHIIEVQQRFGELRYYQMSKVSFVRKQSQLPAVVTVAVDVTEQKESIAKIEYLAKHDELTNLPNRSLLVDRLTQSINMCVRYNRNAALIFIDLDLFKNINDTIGHAVGDVLLQVTASRLKKHCRDSDTVARFGGDEFVILLSELSDDLETATQEASNITRKIREEVIKEAQIGKHAISVTVSQGVVMVPSDADKSDKALQRADLAMYRAKAAGRNKVVFFSPEMEQSIKRKERLKADLRRAIRNEELFVMYQPQVDIHANKIIGTEALVRWRCKDQGLIYPLEFIPVAEESGAIIEIGEFVLKEACFAAEKWHQQFDQEQYVTVNLSAQQIAHKHFIKSVDEVLEQFLLPHHLLEFEVTESMLMVDLDRAIKLLSSLRDRGIKVSLDDFGTGYSSLSYLKKLPLDKLKIDKSFVKDIPGDKDSETIAKSIISMASNLGMKVVAEGVETEQQLNFFKEHHCHIIQGYYFSEPLEYKDISQLVVRYNVAKS